MAENPQRRCTVYADRANWQAQVFAMLFGGRIPDDAFTALVFGRCGVASALMCPTDPAAASGSQGRAARAQNASAPPSARVPAPFCRPPPAEAAAAEEKVLALVLVLLVVAVAEVLLLLAVASPASWWCCMRTRRWWRRGTSTCSWRTCAPSEAAPRAQNSGQII